MINADTLWHHYEHCELSSHFGFGSAKCRANKSTEMTWATSQRVACSAPVVTSSRATPRFRHSANLSWSHQGCAAAVASWGIHPRWTGTWGRVCTAVPMPADCSVPADFQRSEKTSANICPQTKVWRKRCKFREILGYYIWLYVQVCRHNVYIKYICIYKIY